MTWRLLCTDSGLDTERVQGLLRAWLCHSLGLGSVSHPAVALCEAEEVELRCFSCKRDQLAICLLFRKKTPPIKW